MPASGQPAFRQTRRRSSARRKSGSCDQAVAAELDAIAIRGQDGRLLQLAQAVLQRPFRRMCQRSQPHQGLGHAGVVLAGQPRQQVVPDPSAGPRQVGVAGVLAIRLPQRLEGFTEFRTRHREQRADQLHRRLAEPEPAPRGHSRRAREAPCRGRSGAGSSRPGRRACARPPRPIAPRAWAVAEQPVVTRTPGVGLEVPGPRGLPASQVEGQAERAGQVLDERRIRPRRLAPRPVVEVRHRERQAELGRQRVEHAEQPHAVAAPRDRHHPGRPRTPARTIASPGVVPVPARERTRALRGSRSCAIRPQEIED